MWDSDADVFRGHYSTCCHAIFTGGCWAAFLTYPVPAFSCAPPPMGAEDPTSWFVSLGPISVGDIGPCVMPSGGGKTPLQVPQCFSLSFDASSHRWALGGGTAYSRWLLLVHLGVHPRLLGFAMVPLSSEEGASRPVGYKFCPDLPYLGSSLTVGLFGVPTCLPGSLSTGCSLAS